VLICSTGVNRRCRFPNRHPSAGLESLWRPGPGRVGAPPQAPSSPRSGPQADRPGGDLGRPAGAESAALAKGLGIDPPGTWPTLLAYCQLRMPGFRPPFWAAMVGRAWRAPFNAIPHGGRRTPANQRLLPAFAAGPPLNPSLYPALEAGLRRCRNNLARRRRLDGEGATCTEFEVQVEGGQQRRGRPAPSPERLWLLPGENGRAMAADSPTGPDRGPPPAALGCAFQAGLPWPSALGGATS